MNRKIKNIVIFVMILVMCVLSYFTMSEAMKNSMPNNRFRNDQSQGETPPNFNNEEMTERSSENFNSKNQGEKPEMPEGGFQNGERPNIKDFKPNISAIYYILFVVEALIISLLILYLIMSKFNEKTLKETLGNSKKMIIFAILTIIITIGLTFLQITLARNMFTEKNKNQLENRQMFRNNYNNTNVIQNSNETGTT